MIFKVQTKEEGVDPVKDQGKAFQAPGASSKIPICLEKFWSLTIAQMREDRWWN